MTSKSLQSQWFQYGQVFVLVAIAALGRVGLDRLEVDVKFLPFFLAVVTSACIGGWKPGLLATILSAWTADLIFFRFDVGPGPDDSEYTTRLLVFLASSVVILAFLEMQRRSQRKAEALVKELQTQLARQEQTESQLAISEERYRSLFENNHDPVFTLDMNGCFATANPSALKLCGYTLEELQRMQFTAFCRPEHHLQAIRYFQLALKGEPESTFELTIPTREGRRVDLLLTGGPIKARGQSVGTFAVAADVTQRKRAQIQLRAFSKLGQQLSSATTPVNAGRIIGDAAGELFGWDTFSLNLYSLETDQADYVLNVDTFEGQKTEILPFLSAPGIPPLAHRAMEQGPQLVLVPQAQAGMAASMSSGSPPSASMMLAPIKDHDRTIGILSVGKRQNAAYDEQDLQTMVALADYCSGALQRIWAREALRRNEQEYRLLFDSDGSGKCQEDAHTGEILKVNPKFCELTGCSEEELVGKCVLEIIHPGDRDESQRNRERLLNSVIEEARMEKRYLRKDNSVCWVDTTLTLVHDDHGRPSRMMRTSIDINVRKATEEALALSNQRLSLIAEVTNAVIGDEPLGDQMRAIAETVRTAYGVDACIIRVFEEDSLALLGWAGIERESLKIHLPADFRVPRELMKTRRPVFVPDLPAYISSDEKAPLLANPGFVSFAAAPLLAQDRMVGIVGLFTREHMHEFNPVDLEHLQIIANHIAVAIANSRLYEELKRQKTVLEQEVRERQQAENEVQQLNADLELRVQDRTRELRMSNAELEAFAYSVSHDLRGPLRSVVGFAEGLKDECGECLNAEGEEYLGRILQAGREMDELIDDLLHLSRLSRVDMKRQPVNLTIMAEGIIGKLRESEPERRVKVSISPGLVVPADARLMRIALENLLNNAWKFTRRKRGAQIEFGKMTQAEGTAYFVRDNGAGFDMAFAGKLFGAFQRLHSTHEFPGHGIGLATVQRVIQRHGGRTWAIGEVDQGASFFFTLPT